MARSRGQDPARTARAKCLLAVVCEANTCLQAVHWFVLMSRDAKSRSPCDRSKWCHSPLSLQTMKSIRHKRNGNLQPYLRPKNPQPSALDEHGLAVALSLVALMASEALVRAGGHGGAEGRARHVL